MVSSCHFASFLLLLALLMLVSLPHRAAVLLFCNDGYDYDAGAGKYDDARHHQYREKLVWVQVEGRHRSYDRESYAVPAGLPRLVPYMDARHKGRTGAAAETSAKFSLLTHYASYFCPIPSGSGQPPLRGDAEAQRHWVEIAGLGVGGRAQTAASGPNWRMYWYYADRALHQTEVADGTFYDDLSHSELEDLVRSLNARNITDPSNADADNIYHTLHFSSHRRHNNRSLLRALVPVINDPLYWGLDYPPLSALHAYWIYALSPLWLRYSYYGWFRSWWAGAPPCGGQNACEDLTLLVQRSHQRSFGLLLSRGYEGADVRHVMFSFVFLSEAIFYWPPIVILALIVRRIARPLRTNTARSAPLALTQAFVVSAIPLYFIDYGHFQYNCVTIGLFTAAFAAVAAASIDWGAEQADHTQSFFCRRGNFISLAATLCSTVAIVLAVLFKITTLYLLPPFAFFALATVLTGSGFFIEPVTKHAFFFKRFTINCLRFIGLTAIFSIIGLVLPGYLLLRSVGGTAVLPVVLHRVFPIARGLFEDKVANAWCLMSPVVKLPLLVGRLLRLGASVWPSAVGRLTWPATGIPALPSEGVPQEHVQRVIVLICTIVTLIAILPACLAVLISRVVACRAIQRLHTSKRPSSTAGGANDSSSISAAITMIFMRIFSLAAVSCSLGFFLFSYQVHEKSILPAIGATNIALFILFVLPPAPPQWGNPLAAELLNGRLSADVSVLHLFLAASQLSLFHLAIKDYNVPFFNLCNLVMMAGIVGSSLALACRHYYKRRGANMLFEWANMALLPVLYTALFYFLHAILLPAFVDRRFARLPHLGLLVRLAWCGLAFAAVAGYFTVELIRRTAALKRLANIIENM